MRMGKKELRGFFKSLGFSQFEFNEENTKLQMKRLKNMDVVSIIYCILGTISSVLIFGNSYEDSVMEYLPLFISSVVTFGIAYVWCKSEGGKSLKSRKVKMVVGTIILTISLMLFIAWGNYQMHFEHVTGREITCLVWMIVLVILAATFTVLPCISFPLLLLSYIFTVTQMKILCGVIKDQYLFYNLSFYIIAIGFLVIEKYILGLKKFLLDKSQKEAFEDKERFMVSITHEMRTPLNAVLGKNQIIFNETKEENTRMLSREIKASGKLLLGFIGDILDLSKLESGKMSINPVSYKSSTVSYEIADIMRSEAVGKGLGFKLEVSENLPSGLYGDDTKIRQVIMNLVSNAIKYTKEGSVTLRIWFSYNNKPEKKGLLNVMVIDTGIGIKEEDLPKLTRAFSRLDDANTRNIQGTGLGLAISASILQLMGSELKVESTYEIGSTFSFSVEQLVTDESSLRENDPKIIERRTKAFSAPLARVLVVDDNNVNFSVCAGLMKYYKIVPKHAESGEECLELLKERDFDLVFLDHMMPGLSGIETLERIKKELPEAYDLTPIIALTANDNDSASYNYKELGFSDYLGKPIDAEKLYELLDKYIDDAIKEYE